MNIVSCYLRFALNFILISFWHVLTAPLNSQTLASTNSLVHSELSPIDSNLVKITQNKNKTKFYVNDAPTDRFNCNFTRNVTKFSWLYQWNNGETTPINVTSRISSVPSFDSVKFIFTNRNVTHVVCVVEEFNGSVHNGTYAVFVTEAIKPKILTAPPKAPITYTEGMELLCEAQGDPISTFYWTKNGNYDDVGNQSVIYPEKGENITKSFLRLDPKQSDGKNITYTCHVSNFLGEDSLSYDVCMPETSLFEVWIIVLIAIAVCLSVMLGLLQFVLSQASKPYPPQKCDDFLIGDNSQEDDVALQEPYNADYEIKIKELILGKVLKSGQFGEVRVAEYRNKRVIVKTPKFNGRMSQEEKERLYGDFLNEIKFMQRLGTHPNIVGYIGAVTSNLADYGAMLVLEYCYGGDIGSYLKRLHKLATKRVENVTIINDLEDGRYEYDLASDSSDNDDEETEEAGNGIFLELSTLVKWCRDIAKAMVHLSSRELIHRDLAARNVLITMDSYYDRANPDEFTVKLADFGMSRDVDGGYYAVLGTNQQLSDRPWIKLPIEWVAVETLDSYRLRFTTKSDVWAFGVLIWELFEFGTKEPYRNEGILTGDVRANLINYLQNGNTLPRPQFASDEIWDVIKSCWTLNPDERPDFSQLAERLEAIYGSRRLPEVAATNVEPESLPEGYLQLG